MVRLPLFRFLLPALLLFLQAESSANVTGIVRGVQQNPIAGALVTFTSEANPALSFSGYTSAGGWYDIAISALAVGDVQPAPFTLHQNHPNPFNPSTTITFSTTEPGVVTLSVYNLLGQRVRTLVSGTVPAGEHALVWDGRDDAGTPSGAGVYLYRLTGSGRAEVKKMLLLDGGAAGGGSMSTPLLATPKSAAGTWTVTITGDEIEPREMTGLEIADGGVYDFYVIFMGEMMNFHLVTIPGGTYEMGEEWGDIVISWPGPAHQVALDDFEISAYETTNYQYAQFLNEALAAGEIEMINGDPYGKGGEWDGKRLIDLDTHLPEFMPVEAQCYIKFSNGSFSVMESIRRNWPVVAVNWYGAKAFASHYGLDLPTEAEWEYAAGGGILEYEYATDDGTLDRLKANYNFAAIGPNEKDLRHVLEIGSYPPNPFGLFDMTGNIKEWCNDWYDSYPSLYNETLDWHDTHIPPSYVIVNPTGPDRMDGSKIIRGGSFDTGIQFPLPECRTTYRYFLKPTGTIGSHNEIEYELGFRVARRPSPTAKGATP